MSNILSLPIDESVYNHLPPSLKLLAWHVAKGDRGAFASWLSGNAATVQTKATCLWFQDYTGLPEINNLAAQREALVAMGKDPSVIRAKVPTHMVFDHSVRTTGSFSANMQDEARLNGDRLRLAKWAERELGIRVVPPGKGVIHQVNTERLLQVFDEDGRPLFGKGTDSHSPMVNALCILAWGVGGTEAMKVFAGERIGMAIPDVVGVRLSGELSENTNASDLALYLKKVLRDYVLPKERNKDPKDMQKGPIGAFVEFFGEGVDTLPLESRATIANVAAEFGSRVALFCIDDETVRYLALSGREAGVEERAKAYGLWRSDENEESVIRTDVIDVDLSKVERGISGPDKPHNWVPLTSAQAHVEQVFQDKGVEDQSFTVVTDDGEHEVANGALLLASIASCTQTANPEAVLRAALLARNAVNQGLHIKPWVKTAFAAGSPVADEYLAKLELVPYLEQLGFAITAHGCGACIGQSGGLNDVGNDLLSQGIKGTSIVSANRNYAGRQDANISISFLGRPDLVIAYAIAGRMDVDIEEFDLGGGVRLRDIMPGDQEIAEATRVINADMYNTAYESLFEGDANWQAIEAPEGPVYDWPEGSVTVQRPPFFEGMSAESTPVQGLKNARTLVIVGDSFSTDAISPAGAPITIPAAMAYLKSNGVTNRADVLSIGGYRSNSDMLSATIFSNPTNQNKMVNRLGGWTIHHPSGDEVSIFEAAKRYRQAGVSQVVIGGKAYGCGSSRVMAATGPWMLGVRAVVAESFEAIHRANLWQAGLVPLTFRKGVNAETLKLDGSETWDIPLDELTSSSKTLDVSFTLAGGEKIQLTLNVALEDPQEFGFLLQGGAMQQQLRELAA